VKNGFQSGKPRLKCKVCGLLFVAVRSHKPQWTKELALWLYQSRMTIRGIAKVLQVSPPTILNWLRDLGPKAVEKPISEKVRTIQIDEVWHYLGEKTKNLGMARS
jgi:transposase-like protein